MKTLCRRFTLMVFLAVSLNGHAQFYTIGKGYSSSAETSEGMGAYCMGCDRTDAEEADVACVHELLSLPLRDVSVASGFGMRYHPVFHRNMLHNGVDLKAHYEVVYSMLPGRVVRVGYDSRSGNYVTVKSADYTISYCHLSNSYVKASEYVTAGSPIACSGNTGASTGPHLHLTVRKDGKYQNPAILLSLIKKNKSSSETK